MRVSTLVIGVLILGFVVTGFYAFVNTLAGEDAYDMEVSAQYEEAFNQTTEISVEISSQFNELTNYSVNILTFAPMVGKVVSLVKNTITLPAAIYVDVVTSVVKFVGLPPWVQTFLIAVIPAIIIFAVVAIVLRFKYT